MPVDSQHPLYKKYLPVWQQQRILEDGERGVKAWNAGKTLLPPISQEQVERGLYDGYLRRAKWVDFHGRALAGLVGAVFRKDPEITGLPQDYIDDIDRCGTTLIEFAKRVVYETLAFTRGGVFAERPAGKSERSHLVRVDAEAMWNWQAPIIGGVRRATLWTLAEPYADGGDEFAPEVKTQLRLLRLIDGKYVQQIYRQGQKGAAWELAEEIIPRRNGAALDEIPFEAIPDIDPESPIILPLSDLNVHHYQLGATLLNILEKLMPQMIVYTAKQDEEFVMGTDRAWVLMVGDKAEVLAPSAATEAIERELAKDESRMVLMGSRLLEAQKREAETAETMRLRQAGESATLADVAQMVSLKLTRVLRAMARWDRLSEAGVEIKLNQDFTGAPLTPEEAISWTDARDAGAMTDEDHYIKMQQGGVTAVETFRQWMADLESRTPSRPPQMPAVPGVPVEDATDEEAA